MEVMMGSVIQQTEIGSCLKQDFIFFSLNVHNRKNILGLNGKIIKNGYFPPSALNC